LPMLNSTHDVWFTSSPQAGDMVDLFTNPASWTNAVCITKPHPTTNPTHLHPHTYTHTPTPTHTTHHHTPHTTHTHTHTHPTHHTPHQHQLLCGKKKKVTQQIQCLTMSLYYRDQRYQPTNSMVNNYLSTVQLKLVVQTT